MVCGGGSDGVGADGGVVVIYALLYLAACVWICSWMPQSSESSLKYWEGPKERMKVVR